MKYDQIKVLEEEKFRRLTGVKPSTFCKMVGIFKAADEVKKAQGGPHYPSLFLKLIRFGG